MLPNTAWTPVQWLLFQSSPDPEAGGYSPQIDTVYLGMLFQSSPDPEAGCYSQLEGGSIPGVRVSILTRPGGRVLPLHNLFQNFFITGFNPHPTRRPGATLVCCCSRWI